MKSEELKRSIELEIQKYEQKLNVTSIGYVLQSGDGIAIVYGLSGAMSGELIKFSKERDRTVLELAFAWLLYNKDISSVIAGATKPEQVIANSGAADWVLTDEEYDEVTGYLS